MFDLTLMTGKVINIDDQDKQGKIQISIESISDGWKKELLPWAIPLISNVSDSTMEMHLPKVGSQIWLLVDKYYKRFYYISNRYFYNLFDFSKISGLLSKCEKINNEYKNLNFKYYEDGTLLFHNNDDGSSGIITSVGTLMYVDEDGSLIKQIEKDEKIIISGNKEENIKGNQTIEVKGNSIQNYKTSCKINGEQNLTLKSNGTLTIMSKSPLTLGASSSTLGMILTELCTDLSALVTVGNERTQSSPTLTAQMMSLIQKIKQNFS